MSARLSALFSALAFSSRLPVPPALAATPLAEAAAMLPVAGLLVALPAAAVMVLAAALGASSLLAATLAVVAMIVLTGALHEDGLADCADGFWGGSTRERRLEIMRDSRIGTFGVLALVGAVALKVGAIETALRAGPLTAALVMVSAAAAARAVALFAWIATPPARTDGLAVAFGRPSLATFRRAVVVAILVSALLTVWWTPIGFLLAGLAAAATAKGCASLAERRIGGHTGDVIGATVVLADLSYLLALTMWSA